MWCRATPGLDALQTQSSSVMAEVSDEQGRAVGIPAALFELQMAVDLSHIRTLYWSTVVDQSLDHSN